MFTRGYLFYLFTLYMFYLFVFLHALHVVYLYYLLVFFVCLCMFISLPFYIFKNRVTDLYFWFLNSLCYIVLHFTWFLPFYICYLFIHVYPFLHVCYSVLQLVVPFACFFWTCFVLVVYYSFLCADLFFYTLFLDSRPFFTVLHALFLFDFCILFTCFTSFAFFTFCLSCSCYLFFLILFFIVLP